jgi:hypothetical protein
LKKPVTIRFSKKISKELHTQSKNYGISVNAIVNFFCRRGLDDMNPETFRGQVNQLLGADLGDKLIKYREDNNDERME